MAFVRLFNSRSFRLAKRFSKLQGSAEQTQLSKRFIRPIPRLPYNPDITATQGIMWIVFGGIPFGLFGFYVTKVLKDAVEADEAGLLMPGTGPKYRLTNDQWLALKQEAAKLQSEADEEEEEGGEELLAAVAEDVEESSSIEILSSQEPTSTQQEAEPIGNASDPSLNFGKDTVIFIESPSK